jgi:hypothetical protein
VVVKQKVQGRERIDGEQEKQVGKASVVVETVKGSRICNRRSDGEEEKSLCLSIPNPPVPIQDGDQGSPPPLSGSWDKRSALTLLFLCTASSEVCAC